jgi:hypothetical protein
MLSAAAAGGYCYYWCCCCVAASTAAAAVAAAVDTADAAALAHHLCAYDAMPLSPASAPPHSNCCRCIKTVVEAEFELASG